MIAQTQTTLAIIYSHQSTLKYVDSCCVLLLSASRRDCVRRFESRLTTYKMLALNSSRLTIFCGQYGYSFWPIWSFRVADVVVADMVCGRYGLWPIWYRPFYCLLTFHATNVLLKLCKFRAYPSLQPVDSSQQSLGSLSRPRLPRGDLVW